MRSFVNFGTKESAGKCWSGCIGLEGEWAQSRSRGRHAGLVVEREERPLLRSIRGPLQRSSLLKVDLCDVCERRVQCMRETSRQDDEFD